MDYFRMINQNKASLKMTEILTIALKHCDSALYLLMNMYKI